MEMAISMLVIVPVILYALFMDDLLRFRLDAQEAAVSSVWDFTNRSYQQRTGSANDAYAVQHVDRLIFCDHSSAFDSFNRNQDCEDPRHHVAVAGHVCWLIGGSEQVTCKLADAKLGTSFTGGPAMMPANKFVSSYNKGGFFTCEAKEAVLNYLIPKHFFTQFTTVKLTDKKKSKGNVHTAASGAGQDAVYDLPREQLGLLADTWAMNDIPDIDPGKKGGIRRPEAVLRPGEHHLHQEPRLPVVRGCRRGLLRQGRLQRAARASCTPRRPSAGSWATTPSPPTSP